MYDETYFKNRVNNFYQEVDKGFRTLGCEAFGAQDIFYRLSRVATPAVEYSEIKRILADIDAPPTSIHDPSGHRRWPFAWGRAVKQYKAIAEEAERKGFKVTAGVNFLRASLLAHSGQIFCRPEWPEKLELQKERAGCYRRAAPYLGIETLQVPYEGGHKLPAYLKMPAGVERPPVVIMAPGANSVKEELHRWVPAFVERGIAAMTFDGLGQGELTPLQGSNLPMRYDEYHKVFTAMIDFLEKNYADRVDLDRIALWGQSMGGHLATRSYIKERRPKAIINLGGLPTMFDYPFLPPDVMEEARDLLGFETYEEAWEYVQKHGDGLEPAKAIDIPYLIVHGSRDDIVDDSAMHELVQAVGKTAEIVVYEDGNHGVFNWDFIMTDAMADWLLEKLK